MLGLLSFFVLYAALAVWFAWVGWRLSVDTVREDGPKLIAGLMAAASFFLSAFMIRALFFLREKRLPNGIEVTPASQPQLFEFLGRLAAEVGARPPRKVYVSANVNAAVSFDISIWNLLMPSRRNLEIGLGLVNVMTLLELKAVLAHEFGHFSQRSMLFGRWAYVGGQVAGRLVAKRDAFDRFLDKSTRVIVLNPLGLLWLVSVWTVRLCIWAIREVTDASFRLLLVAQRAISREMEFQADLVAVSVTGSDPPVHALLKLPAAEVALQNAVSFAVAERDRGAPPPDLFDLQNVALERLRQALATPDFGRTPPLPATQRESHRVFRSTFAQPPSMWATHPLGTEREENCKRRYVPSHDTGMDAWSLFVDVDALRATVTAATLKFKDPATGSRDDARLKFGKTFDRPSLNRTYQGAYLRASLARRAERAEDLCGPSAPGADLQGELDALYPPSLGQDIDLQKQLTGERNYLRGLQNGSVTWASSTLVHRGVMITQSNLPSAVLDVEADLETVTRRINEHDRRCRALHRAAAATIGGGWDAYLRGLLDMLHYAEHAQANLLLAQQTLSWALAANTRAGRIEAKNFHHILGPANKLYDAIHEAFVQRSSVSVDAALSSRLGVAQWPLNDYQYNLVVPTAQNLGSWLGTIPGWTRACLDAFGRLRHAALDQLLEAEALVADAVRQHRQLAPAPVPSVVPAAFTRLPLGAEPGPPAKKDWLERWQGRSGVLASGGRVAAAFALIGLISVASLKIGGAEDARKEYAHGLAAAAQSNFHAAADWYRKAAAQGLAQAESNLGILYSEGKGVTQDLPQAAALFRQAAEQKDPQAQLNLAIAYLKGNGVPKDYGQALNWFRQAADQRLAAAQFEVGLMTAQGLGTRADPVAAVNWYRLAANQNNANAQASLGLAYQQGIGVQKDLAQALTWFRKSAAAGNVPALYQVGAAYFQGSGVEQNYTEAVSWLRRAADLGDLHATVLLGFAYAKGLGVEQNEASAASWLQKASDQGDPNAEAALAGMYARGSGVPKDPALAFSLALRAAEAGNAGGQVLAGAAYFSGTGTAQDYAKALMWFHKAADQGSPAAETNLGFAYLNGEGVEKNPVNAVEWFRKAAEQGYPLAEADLGLAYAKGSGVAQDNQQALQWFRKAADQGNAIAQTNLALHYLRGDGVPVDVSVARLWLGKAAAQNFEPARKLLVQIKGR